jgi:curli biogenesis system outer membrane secretion channel CsgG
VGERAKVVIFEFENKFVVRADGKRSSLDSVLGNSLKKHLVMGLHQTEQFAVLDPLGAKRVLTSQDFTAKGEIKRKIRNKLGPLDGAEFLIAGVVTAYQPSRRSRNAGIEADPLFGDAGTKQGVTTAALAKAFASLPTASQDRITIEMRLIDAVTGTTISTTSVEGTPQGVGQPRGGLFDEKLSTPTTQWSTPMQKALRACTIKAVDWIAETSLAHRGRAVALPAPLSPVGEKPRSSKKPIVEKKNVREKPGREPIVKKREVSERPLTEKPTVEKPSAPKPGGERPIVEKPVPKKEALRSEEWGQ